MYGSQMELTSHSVVQLTEMLDSSEVSATEIVNSSISAIGALNPVLNAFVSTRFEAALEEAKQIDTQRAGGQHLPILAGLPFGVKDLEDLKSERTSKGSPLFAKSAPAVHDSVLVERLRRHGAIAVGKTNTPEFGWRADSVNPVFGATKNPFDPERSSGGSSGGSSSAVASGMVPFATGSDGGGSIRIPSSLCGLAGFKSSGGLIPAWSSAAPNWGNLSVVGPMAKRLGDVAFLLDLVVGTDNRDLRSAPGHRGSFYQEYSAPIKPIKVAYSPTLGYAKVDSEVASSVEAAVRRLETSGVSVELVEKVFDVDPVVDFVHLTGAGTWRTVKEFAGTREWDLMDPRFRQMVEQSAQMTLDRYLAAVDACHGFNLQLSTLFDDYDLLITPTLASLAPLSDQFGLVDGVPQENWICFTYPFNMCQNPAVTLNIGLSSSGGLPIGMQLVAPRWQDLRLMSNASYIDKVVGVDAVPDLGSLTK